MEWKLIIMYERVGFTFPSCVKRHLQASSISLCLLIEKNAFYLSVNVFGTIVLIRGTMFTSGDGAAILRGHPSHAKV